MISHKTLDFWLHLKLSEALAAQVCVSWAAAAVSGTCAPQLRPSVPISSAPPHVLPGLGAFQPLTLQRNPGLNLKWHPPLFSYWCLLSKEISSICILSLKLYSMIVLNSHTTTAAKHNFSQINYQHVTVCACPQPPCHLLALKKGNPHKHNKMLGGGDYISFILQPEEEEVFALWSLASCSYTVPLHCRDWGEGQKLCQG